MLVKEKIYENKDENIIILGNQSEEKLNISIDKSSKLIPMLISSLYDDPILAFLRELTANAIDAFEEKLISLKRKRKNFNINKLRKKLIAFDIFLPNTYDTTFYIRDYGVGLSDNDFKKVYCQLLASTKENKTNQIGYYGIGSKTPLAYSNEYIITNYHNGYQSIYSFYKDSNNEFKYRLIDKSKTNEPNGIKIAIPIKPKDINKLISKTLLILALIRKDYKINVLTMSEDKNALNLIHKNIKFNLLTSLYKIDETDKYEIFIYPWINFNIIFQLEDGNSIFCKEKNLFYDIFKDKNELDAFSNYSNIILGINQYPYYLGHTSMYTLNNFNIVHNNDKNTTEIQGKNNFSNINIQIKKLKGQFKLLQKLMKHYESKEKEVNPKTKDKNIKKIILEFIEHNIVIIPKNDQNNRYQHEIFDNVSLTISREKIINSEKVLEKIKNHLNNIKQYSYTRQKINKISKHIEEGKFTNITNNLIKTKDLKKLLSNLFKENKGVLYKNPLTISPINFINFLINIPSFLTYSKIIIENVSINNLLDVINSINTETQISVNYSKEIFSNLWEYGINNENINIDKLYEVLTKNSIKNDGILYNVFNFNKLEIIPSYDPMPDNKFINIYDKNIININIDYNVHFEKFINNNFKKLNDIINTHHGYMYNRYKFLKFENCLNENIYPFYENFLQNIKHRFNKTKKYSIINFLEFSNKKLLSILLEPDDHTKINSKFPEVYPAILPLQYFKKQFLAILNITCHFNTFNKYFTYPLLDNILASKFFTKLLLKKSLNYEKKFLKHLKLTDEDNMLFISPNYSEIKNTSDIDNFISILVNINSEKVKHSISKYTIPNKLIPQYLELNTASSLLYGDIDLEKIKKYVNIIYSEIYTNEITHHIKILTFFHKILLPLVSNFNIAKNFFYIKDENIIEKRLIDILNRTEFLLINKHDTIQYRIKNVEFLVKNIQNISNNINNIIDKIINNIDVVDVFSTFKLLTLVMVQKLIQKNKFNLDEKEIKLLQKAYSFIKDSILSIIDRYSYSSKIEMEDLTNKIDISQIKDLTLDTKLQEKIKNILLEYPGIKSQILDLNINNINIQNIANIYNFFNKIFKLEKIRTLLSIANTIEYKKYLIYTMLGNLIFRYKTSKLENSHKLIEKIIIENIKFNFDEYMEEVYSLEKGKLEYDKSQQTSPKTPKYKTKHKTQYFPLYQNTILPGSNKETIKECITFKTYREKTISTKTLEKLLQNENYDVQIFVELLPKSTIFDQIGVFNYEDKTAGIILHTKLYYKMLEEKQYQNIKQLFPTDDEKEKFQVNNKYYLVIRNNNTHIINYFKITYSSLNSIIKDFPHIKYKIFPFFNFLLFKFKKGQYFQAHNTKEVLNELIDFNKILSLDIKESEKKIFEKNFLKPLIFLTVLEKEDYSSLTKYLEKLEIFNSDNMGAIQDTLQKLQIISNDNYQKYENKIKNIIKEKRLTNWKNILEYVFKRISYYSDFYFNTNYFFYNRRKIYDYTLEIKKQNNNGNNSYYRFSDYIWMNYEKFNFIHDIEYFNKKYTNLHKHNFFQDKYLHRKIPAKFLQVLNILNFNKKLKKHIANLYFKNEHITINPKHLINLSNTYLKIVDPEFKTFLEKHKFDIFKNGNLKISLNITSLINKFLEFVYDFYRIIYRNIIFGDYIFSKNIQNIILKNILKNIFKFYDIRKREIKFNIYKFIISFTKSLQKEIDTYLMDNKPTQKDIDQLKKHIYDIITFIRFLNTKDNTIIIFKKDSSDKIYADTATHLTSDVFIKKIDSFDRILEFIKNINSSIDIIKIEKEYQIQGNTYKIPIIGHTIFKKYQTLIKKKITTDVIKNKIQKIKKSISKISNFMDYIALNNFKIYSFLNLNSKTLSEDLKKHETYIILFLDLLKTIFKTSFFKQIITLQYIIYSQKLKRETEIEKKKNNLFRCTTYFLLKEKIEELMPNTKIDKLINKYNTEIIQRCATYGFNYWMLYPIFSILYKIHKAYKIIEYKPINKTNINKEKFVSIYTEVFEKIIQEEIKKFEKMFK